MVLLPSQLTRLLYENQSSVEEIFNAIKNAQVLSEKALLDKRAVINEIESIFAFYEGGKRDGEITGPTMCDAIEGRLRQNDWLNEKGLKWSDSRF